MLKQKREKYENAKYTPEHKVILETETMRQ